MLVVVRNTSKFVYYDVYQSINYRLVGNMLSPKNTLIHLWETLNTHTHTHTLRDAHIAIICTDLLVRRPMVACNPECNPSFPLHLGLQAGETAGHCFC